MRETFAVYPLICRLVECAARAAAARDYRQAPGRAAWRGDAGRKRAYARCHFPGGPMFRTSLAAALLFATPAAAQQLTPDQTAQVDRIVADALVSSKVPSASIAIVRDGRIVYAKAYGDQGPGLPRT